MKNRRMKCYCARLRRAGNKMKNLYNRCLEPMGITSSQYALLSHLKKHGPISVSGLAEKMELERTTLVRNLKPLEAKGYIQDTAHTGRGRQLELTQEGERVRKEAKGLWTQAQQYLEGQLGRKRMNQFQEIIGMIDEMELPAREDCPLEGAKK